MSPLFFRLLDIKSAEYPAVYATTGFRATQVHIIVHPRKNNPHGGFNRLRHRYIGKFLARREPEHDKIIMPIPVVVNVQ